jgi:histone H2B
MAKNSKKSHGKNNRRSKDLSFTRSIFKVFKHMNTGLTISKNSMKVITNFVNDIFERMVAEGSHIQNISKKKTLSSRTVHTAVKLVIAGDLKKHSIFYGTKAVTRYQSSKRKL